MLTVIATLGINFRFDQSSSRTILDLLQRNEPEMAQGWGGSDVNLDLRREDFVQATLNRYESDGMKSTRIPTNLSRMRTFRDGDLLVTPHLPERGKVSIHVLNGDYPSCYRYVPNDGDHLNHRILIRRSFGLDGNISLQRRSLWMVRQASVAWTVRRQLDLPADDN